jgi:16S rRNA (adenine1518-N6/adenine1519-N6)-dimethyltransferase
VELAGVGPTDRVVEVGPGLGSLTVALARTGASVVAVEIDPRLVGAVADLVGEDPRVRVVTADAVAVEWGSLLDGEPWAMVANLPYNVAVPVVLRVLEVEPRVERFVVMVQREVGERLSAAPGDEQFGAVSLKVAYRAEAKVVRRVARSVFWPRPNVDSVIVSIERRPPPVEVDEASLWRVVDEAFSQRRKTTRSALVRLRLSREAAIDALARCGLDPDVRPERLGLEAFACLTDAVADVR